MFVSIIIIKLLI